MKKIILATAMLFSLSTSMASNELNDNILHKAPANSGILQTINGFDDQCFETCINEYINCTNNAQGSGGWVYCEIMFERCEANCF